ncbi:general substrate transporter [Mytilinidion resinicola]|uniref:General substrate transporter n=1 Tax=Mytilinidion resinicola TaxID=574789 RepID=A0A6A6Z0J8_9PEZI|nr:general substrate transporter [Mytilinidion resinicola]KAF2814692.1 general substrate transporter [Mytilinidion resinicola]
MADHQAVPGIPLTSTITPHTTYVNIVTILVAGMGSFLFGYANNSIAGTLAQTSFIEKFLTGSNATSIIDGILGGFQGGGLIGAILQAPISQRFGRRAATGTAAALVTFSAALQAGSVNIAMFLAARVICGIGAGIVITNCPVYMSEIAPPHIRGMLVGNHAISIVYAYIFSSVVALGFYFIDAPYAWRLQYVMLAFFGLMLGVSLFFLPESPRWLCEKERHDEAWIVLRRLHQSKQDPDAQLARAEMAQMKAQIESERSLPTGYIHIFRTPHLRHRAFCCILVWVMGQSTGILVIANLTPVLFGQLGFGPVLQLGLSIVWVTVALIGCFINAALMDRFGRVKLLVTGGFLCSSTLIVEAILQKYYLGSTDKTGINAAVAMYFLWILFYGSTVDCAAYVYISEIWPTHLRSNGTTIGLVSFFACSIAYTSPASEGFATIGWKYYWVMICVCLVSATAIFFVLPETAKLTLEEIGERFGDAVVVHFGEQFESKTNDETPAGNGTEKSGPELNETVA